jgi:acetyltransferase-like isoleucine patch superfamily enzyme
MRFSERVYRSYLGRIMSAAAQLLARIQQPFMVYGYYDHASKSFRKWTRMSSNVIIMNKEKLSIADYVWVWHHSILDATEGLIIGEGVQVGAWVGIFTHGSEKAIRLLGSEFIHIPNSERLGYTRGCVKIGAYTFIGAGSVILPGVKIGKGCLIGTGTLVTKDIPDYAIVVGSPGVIKGSTLELDEEFVRENDLSTTYYDPQALNLIKQKITNEKSTS